jgi:NAD-dependent SIR2 family protein deacetylase
VQLSVAWVLRVYFPAILYAQWRLGETIPGVIMFETSAKIDLSTPKSPRCQVVLVVGTSAVVQPAASMALWARQAGAQVVEINPDPTPLTAHCDVVFSGKAGEVLPLMMAYFDTGKRG